MSDSNGSIDESAISGRLSNADDKDHSKSRHHAHQPSVINPAIPQSVAQQAAEKLASLAEQAGNGGAGTDSLSQSIGGLTIDEEKKRSDDKAGQTKKKAISYAAERVIGNGSFGVVYQATVIDTGETVAIKKVLQDKRFKNRELEIMSMLDHTNVVTLKHCFYSKGDKPDDVYLNLVMEYVPETIHRTLRNHTKANKLVPLLYTKVYIYQLARAVSYIHSVGVTHRDIKPQNILLNFKTHEVRLCDFGSAKMLVKGEPNVAYICSRYYRAPELVFEATEYTSSIDIWSLGCVFAELLLGNPIFPGDSGVGQLIEIIRVLGSPSREEVLAMNPAHTSFKFPVIKTQPWSKVFRNKAPLVAIDLISKWLRYEPKKRLDPFESLAHPFFDELREVDAKLPNGKPMPELYNFTPAELKIIQAKGLANRLLPQHVRAGLNFPASVYNAQPTQAFNPEINLTITEESAS